MKIKCAKNELIQGIQIVLSAVSTKSSLPVLSNILFEAKEGGKVKLATTDLEIGVTTYINAEVLKEGGVTIPAKKLHDIIKEITTDEIEIKSNDDARVYIDSGTSHFSIMGLHRDDFPVLPDFNTGDGEFVINKDILKSMLKKTVFAVSYDETRYVLNGLYMELDKGKLKFVATDGRRLAYIINNVEADKKLRTTVIIPTKAVNELNRLLSIIETENVNVGIKDNQIAFKIGEHIMVSRLIEGSFPNYEQVIPKNNETHVIIDKEDFMAVTRRVALMTSDKMNSIKYQFSDNKLKVSTSSQGIGEAEDELAIEYDGPTLEMAYNPMFIIDVLKNIETNTIKLEVSGALNPGILKPAGNDDYLCVVMPMRLS
ncbi:MAG: DNA polymerase III subunit beta [Elusimicrobiota bacterium]